MSLLVLAAAAVQASGAPAIAITDFAGEIRIEQGEALGARVERADPDGPVSIEETGAGLVIDGGRDMRRWRCRGGWRNTRVGPDRRSARPFEELPLLIITTPEPAALDLDDSIVRGAAGDLASLELGMAHCGAFQAGAVTGDANIGLSGSSDVTLGDIGGAASIAVSGSSDVTLGDVTGALAVSISGSGDVSAGDADSLEARTSGSGGVSAGAIGGALVYSASGSGDLEAVSALGLEFRSSGSADLDLDRLEGSLDVILSGSGDVAIGEGRADPFRVHSTGSGGVDFGGTAANIEVRLSGSGGVRIGAAEGAQTVRSTGSGDFEVGG